MICPRSHAKCGGATSISLLLHQGENESPVGLWDSLDSCVIQLNPFPRAPFYGTLLLLWQKAIHRNRGASEPIVTHVATSPRAEHTL